MPRSDTDATLHCLLEDCLNLLNPPCANGKNKPDKHLKMLFFSFFKTLVNHEVTVELKNDISIRGTLKSVDQYLNIKLDDISVVEELKYPHLVSATRGTILAMGPVNMARGVGDSWC